MADAVRKDDEELGRVEQLPRPEEDARELLPQKSAPRPARAVHDEDGVADDARLIFYGSPDGRVVQLQLRQDLAAAEAKVADHEVALRGRGITRPRRLRGLVTTLSLNDSGRVGAQRERAGGEEHDASHHLSLFT